MEQFLVGHKIWIELITAIGAVIFGFWQILINRRLKSLQDYVAIAATPDSRTNKINLLNTGKINLYLWGFDIPGNKQRLKKSRLIAAGTGDNSYYWLDPPYELKNGQEFEFKLYLEDEFGSKWISEHGGRADEMVIKQDGKETKGIEIKVWSYKTYKKRWSFR